MLRFRVLFPVSEMLNREWFAPKSIYMKCCDTRFISPYQFLPKLCALFLLDGWAQTERL